MRDNVRVKIRQIGDKVATAGLHLGGTLTRRKLHPGEVMEIPAGIMEGGRPLSEILLGTGVLEITREQVTRPFEFENEREARLTSPTYRPRSDEEEQEVEDVKREVALRLAEPATLESLVTPPRSVPIKATDEPPPVKNGAPTPLKNGAPTPLKNGAPTKTPEPPVVEPTPAQTPSSRRAKRREAARADSAGIPT